MGLPDLKPLDPDRMERPLGPAYGFGQIVGNDEWGYNITGRVEDCDLSKDNCNKPGHEVHEEFKFSEYCDPKNPHYDASEWLRNMKKMHQDLIKRMPNVDSLEEFGKELDEMKYHGLHGHNRIGLVCSPLKHEGIVGAMLPSETSARDPIFYSWHLHIEELFEKYKDTVKGPYKKSDFTLSDGLKVLDVKTIMEKSQIPTENDVVNTLVTYEENDDGDDENETKGTQELKYNKIGHRDYKYQIRIQNPQRSTKKVIVRIWLALGSSFYVFVFL